MTEDELEEQRIRRLWARDFAADAEARERFAFWVQVVLCVLLTSGAVASWLWWCPL